MISLEEARNFNPLIDASHFIGALLARGRRPLRSVGHHPCLRQGGAPARCVGGTLHPGAVARAARDGTWDVVTDKGTVHAEHVVNCAVCGRREIGHMVGIELPVLAMEHHYLLTEEPPGARGPGEGDRQHDRLRRRDLSAQERGGVLIGTYEPHGVVWSSLKTPETFSMQLLPEDFERLAPYFEVGFRHFPALDGSASGRR